jgi:tRNA(fMet)-specific endonuclease VapC
MFCLDANIVIFALNKRRPEVEERLEAELAAGTRMSIPSIVLFELEYGVAKSNRPERSAAILAAFLEGGFDILPFDAEDAREAGAIRAHLELQGTPIGYYDTLIAAQVRRRDAALVTMNRRQFERVPGLMVTDWGT